MRICRFFLILRLTFLTSRSKRKAEDGAELESEAKAAKTA